MRIEDAKVIVTCPGRNFVTLKITTDDGLTWHRGRDAERPGESRCRGRLSRGACRSPPHRARRAAGSRTPWQMLYRGAYWRRGPVLRCAPSRRWTWRSSGHQGQGRGDAALRPARRGGKNREGVLVYGHANGADVEQTVDEVERYLGLGYIAPCARRPACRGSTSLTAVSGDKMFYEPADVALPTETVLVDPEIPRPRAEAVRAAAGAAGFRLRALARRPPPADADRGRSSGQGARALSPVLARGPDTGGEPGSVPADPPAHNDPDRRGRGVQHALGRQGPDPGAADRLHPRDRGRRMGAHPPAPHR